MAKFRSEIFQMPKLRLVDPVYTEISSVEKDVMETEDKGRWKEWLILNHFYNEARDVQQQKHLASYQKVDAAI